MADLDRFTSPLRVRPRQSCCCALRFVGRGESRVHQRRATWPLASWGASARPRPRTGWGSREVRTKGERPLTLPDRLVDLLSKGFKDGFWDAGDVIRRGEVAKKADLVHWHAIVADCDKQ